MGYHKNVAASELASNITNTIAVIINYAQTDFWTDILDGVLQRAHELNYKVIIFSAGENDSQLLTQTVNEALEHQAKGILLISGRIEEKQVDILANAHTPYRLVSIYDRQYPEHRFVSSDNVAISEQATNYLIEQGHRRIGLVGVDHSSTGRQRILGYQKAMTDAQLAIAPNWVHYGNYSYETGKKLFPEVKGLGLTAIVAGSDMIAIGLIKAAQKAGIKIPDQLSIVGIDGDPAGEIVSPELTTISQDFQQIGIHSVDNLLKDKKSEFIPTKLIERQSVARLRK